MKRLQRNWKVILGVFVLAVAGTSVWWHFGGTSRATAGGGGGEGYTPVTDVQRSAILGVLQDLHLDVEALAALNVTAAQVEQVLADVRAWVEENHATLAAKDRTIATRVETVRSLEKAIRQGPAEPGREEDLAAARQALASVRQDRQDALASLKTQVYSRLSESQQTNGTAIEAGYGAQMPIRMLALTDTQKHDYGRAWRQFRLRYAAAKTAHTRADAVATWDSASGDILTAQNEQCIEAWQGYVAASAAAVHQAFATVLPPAGAGA